MADIIEYYKKKNAPIVDVFTEKNTDKKYARWLATDFNAYDRVARAWLDGYDVEQEKRYIVKVKGVHFTNYLISGNRKDIWFFHSAYEPEYQRIAHTRKELEDAGFGWVFDCPGIEFEEAEE